ncbi:CRISPR-associated endonuclease Cas2 [Corynebacterium pyruviciproducens]|uniref:CRISPR-associated endonuclease Cas2 n=1 Tax=Corynebacterium pyruviciproducens TaxID=598660 RepID=UPI0023F469A7|nr:CRISPR-associated endonuclease Cas2 [Corynebacterium pyruviciproducens]
MPTTGSEPVWCVVMFDLPVGTKLERRASTQFRNSLLDLGFCRAQFSVYVQYFPLASRISSVVKDLKTCLPAGGDIRILSVTDNQWAKTIRFSNSKAAEPEEKPSQLSIF